MDLGSSDTAARESDSAFAHGTPVATVKVTGESGTQDLQLRKNHDEYYAKSSVVEGAHKVGSDLAMTVDKKLDEFENKKLFEFGYADPNKLMIKSGSKDYSLLRGGQDWWDNGKKMDALSVQSLISNLRDLSAAKFVDSGFTTPEIEATVTSNDGKRTERVLVSKSGSSYIAKRENDPVLYELSTASVDEVKKAMDGIKAAAPASK
jgi:spore coat protein CotH